MMFSRAVLKVERSALIFRRDEIDVEDAICMGTTLMRNSILVKMEWAFTVRQFPSGFDVVCRGTADEVGFLKLW